VSSPGPNHLHYYIASSASFRSKEAQASQLSSCTRLCTFSSLILLAAFTFAACGRVGVLQQCVRPKVLTHVLFLKNNNIILTMPSGYARRLVRITESVVLPHHRSLLGTCPLAGGLCLGAQMMIILCRRRLQTPRAAANGTERPAALRYSYARARSDSAPGGTPHARGLCAYCTRGSTARRAAVSPDRSWYTRAPAPRARPQCESQTRQAQRTTQHGARTRLSACGARSDSARWGTPRGGVRTHPGAHC
jgi:hypothetical protein